MTEYEFFAYVAAGICFVGWLVMLGRLGSLARDRVPTSQKMKAAAFALLWVLCLVVITAANPLGVYKGEGVVFAVVLTVSGAFAYSIMRFMRD